MENIGGMTDIDRLETLYEAFSKTVYWAAFGVLRDMDQSSDVMQNVFLKAHRHIQTLAAMGGEQQRAWLYRAAINAGIDHLRRGKRLVVSEDAGLYEKDAALGPEARAEKSELQRHVRKALMQLPDKYREPLTLYYFADMDYKEISALLSLNEGTLKSRMSRGRALMEKELKKGGGQYA